MPHVVYTLNNAIDSFFSDGGASSSRAECDAFARQRYDADILPVNIQGSTSYTLIAGPTGNKIIQFREQSSLLDTEMLALAKEVHGDIVAACVHLGWIGNPSGLQLAIYEMDRLSGDNYITARSLLTDEQRVNTIHSLASFFAQSWHHGIAIGPGLVDMPAIEAECHSRFEYLVGALPERFLPIVTEVQAALPTLLDGHYPVTITHTDLNEMNILVDPDSGKITGVVDWPGACIQPFGFTLYALENALGSMGSNGWKWFDNVDHLRDVFWKAFVEQTNASEPQMRLIRLAEKAGILIRYGTAFDSGFSGMIGVRDPDFEDFRYLDALLF